ncbi:MAG TPA: hypothetical protein VMM79_07895 [Longimicrobiales bacterium]|nr:hypothetical protein [Longimicrobiales bacterium]
MSRTDLLPQVTAAFALYKTSDKAEIEKELAKVVAGIKAAGMDPEQSPKIAELRVKIQSAAVDVGALESEVYDHLSSFFRRYYSEGDFLSKRVYKDLRTGGWVRVVRAGPPHAWLPMRRTPARRGRRSPVTS